MLKYAFFAFAALLFACSSPKEETVDFDDLAPTSDRYKDGEQPEEDTLTVRNERPAESPFLAVVDTLLTDSRWVKWDTVLYPDRFGAKQQEKWLAVGKKDSLVLLRYEFRDSLLTKNAFFNWIDCFGPKCTSYAVGGNIRIPRRNAVILVGAKQLIVVEGNRAVDEKLVRATLLAAAASGKKPDPKKENWLYVVTVPRSGKAVWKRIDQGEEKPIIRTDENS